jgi:hypothetical protein
MAKGMTPNDQSQRDRALVSSAGAAPVGSGRGVALAVGRGACGAPDMRGSTTAGSWLIRSGSVAAEGVGVGLGAAHPKVFAATSRSARVVSQGVAAARRGTPARSTIPSTQAARRIPPETRKTTDHRP